ncbi:MAG TPA: LysR family transcriptional regulator, partial [Microthrixaceae bacterium]|nr:LysR family transcriptional regulator [Microthrixaceae bacterium]
MDRKQLRAFVAVAEQRSFSAGARVLGTVQSNVSAHVARLEKQLGVLLIDRSTNELTDEGRVVFERARRIEGEFEALDADVASLRDVVSGSVRLGAIGTTARWLVAPLLDSVTAQYPEIRVIVLDATTTSLVPNLASGAVDLAIVNLPVDETDLLVEPLFDEDRILIVPDGHPLADHDSVTLSELSRHELLLEARGTAFRDVLDQAAAAEGVVLHPK